MKALIVDDERHVVDAILLMVPWEDYGIAAPFTASSVPEALELLDRERPEIAFVDVVINDRLGSEILNHIKTQNLPTKVISVSGHDNYQYVRAMFLTGSIDYLLKPLEVDDVLRSLQKALDLLRGASAPAEKEFEIDKMGKHLFPDRQHGLMRELFLEKMRSVAHGELCKINQRIADAETCIVLNSDGMLLPLDLPEYPMQLSRFLNDLQAELESANCGTLFQRSRPAPDIVILLYAEFADMLALIRGACEAFNAKAPRPLQFGCSQPCAFVADIGAACRQAEAASNSIDGQTTDAIILYAPRMETRSKPVDIQLENRIFSAFLIGDREKTALTLHQWVRSIAAAAPHNCGGLHTIWWSFHTLYDKLCNYTALAPNGQNGEFRLSNSTFSSLYTTDWNRTVEAMDAYFAEQLSLLQGTLSRPQTGSSMEQIALFLQMNYDQKIRQQDCANLFYLNKDYMCRSFKKEFGVSMMTYLNQVRMDKAKGLLLNTNMTYQEIADAVGIFDSKYFARQFKHETNQTPAEYRKQAWGSTAAGE